MSAVTARLQWSVPPAALATATRAYRDRLFAAMFDLATYFAAKIETFAKQHASWADRTGHARQGLTGKAFKTATGIVIVLFHVMSYGIWLEVAHAGRYAIILRALEAHYGDVIAAFAKLVKA